MSRGIFWGKTTFLKKIHVLPDHFCTSNKIFSKTWRGSFSTVVWTAFYVSRGRVWAKTNSLESVHLFVIFVTSIKKLRITGKKYQQDRHNCNLGIQKNILWKKYFCEGIIFLNHFRTLNEKNFRFMAIKSRQGCQNCKLRVHGNVFEQNSFFEKIIYFYHFQTLSKNISEIGQKNSAEMSELHFTSPEETFDNCFLKKITFGFKFIQRSYLQKISNFGRGFFAGLRKN